MAVSLPSSFVLRALLRDGRPKVLAPLQDEIFDMGSGVQLVDTATSFAGDGLSFSVSGPAGITIDPTTGVLSIPTDEAYEGERVTVSATNTKGRTTLSFLVTVEVFEEVDEKAETTLASTVVYEGATFIFDKPMPVGYFCNGDPFIVSTEAFSITNDLPAAGEQLDSEDNNFYMNGATWGVYLSSQGNIENGYDTRIGGDNWFVANRSDAPSAPGNGPLEIAQGARGVFVKGISRQEFVGSTDRIKLHRYVLLTVLSAVPPAGAFRPPVRCPEAWRTPKWKESDLNYGVLQNLSDSGLDLPSMSEAFNAIEQTTMTWHTGGHEARNHRTAAPGYNGRQAGKDFSRDFSKVRAWSMCRLHMNHTNEQKRDLLIKMVQMGIDFAGVRADDGQTDNGQWSIAGNLYHGILPPMILAARALGDTELAALSLSTITNDREQQLWPPAIGRSQAWPDETAHSGARQYRQTFQEGHMGIPMFRINHGDDYGSKWLTAYEGGAASTKLETIMAACLIDGGLALWCGTENDPTEWDTDNNRMAAVAYTDRIRRIMDTGSNTTTDQLTPRGVAVYDAYRGELALPIWTGNPEEPWFDGNWPHGTFTPTNGGVTCTTWHLSDNGGDFVRYDARYSMDPSPDATGNFHDPRQWIIVQDVGNSVSLSGLTNGVEHFIQTRVVTTLDSETRYGAWSWIRPHMAQGSAGLGERGRFTPNGTPSGANPSNTTPPGIFVKVGNHQGPSPYVVPNNPAVGTVLRAGVGYWSGKPTSWTYQWSRNGTNISGATSRDYTLTSADLGTDIRVQVAAIEGGNPATSAPVTIP